MNSLLLDVSGWTLAGQAPDRRLWTQPDTDPDSALSVLFFDMPPDTPPLDDIGALRDFYRRVALANQAGMIEVSPWSANGCRGVLTILKLPQVPTGVTYVGSITMPLSASSFVVKIGCAERGVTGTREALVASSLIKSGQLQIDPETNNLVDWSRDPYDATRRDPLMRNLSEDPQYDERFPQHPLSRLRRYLAQVAPSIRLQDGAAVKT